MKYTTEQVVNGIIDYADNEILNKLPTSGKWILGTGIGLATSSANNVADQLKDNAIIKMLGVVDADGMWDIDNLADQMTNTAIKYGNMNIQVPLVGKLTFSASDIERLKSRIEGEA